VSWFQPGITGFAACNSNEARLLLRNRLYSLEMVDEERRVNSMKRPLKRVKRAGNSVIRQYLKEIRKIPLLTVEEERELGHRIQEGDIAAQQRLIESNLRFVITQAKKFARSPSQYPELISAGNFGLIQAARRFDPDLNVRFISYANWWIWQAMYQHVSWGARPFSVSPKIVQLGYRIARLQNSELEAAGSLTSEDLALEIGVSVKDVECVRNLTGVAVSLNQPFDSDGYLELGDTIEQSCIPSPENESILKGLHNQLERSIARLRPLEQTIIRRRFGLEDGDSITLRELGTDLNLSRERVRQIETDALRKLHADETLRCYRN
jgi:RNA polymerase primary sigma factor